MDRFSIEYEKNVRKYLRENEGVNEVDFINHEIQKYTNLISNFEIINDEVIKKEILNSKHYSHLNVLNAEVEGYEDALNHSIKYEKGIKEEILGGYEYYLKEYKFKLTRLPQPIKGSINKTKLLNGKQLNLSERYQIADKIFGIDKKIRSLNLLDAEKYKIISLIFDCNPTNARHVMNGKYPAKVKEDLISTYLNDLMK